MEAIIYTKPGCHYCELAEHFLQDKEAKIVSHSLESVQQLREYLGDVHSFPQIIIDGKHIGGYQQLKREV